jgi:hypothetical protein
MGERRNYLFHSVSQVLVYGCLVPCAWAEEHDGSRNFFISLRKQREGQETGKGQGQDNPKDIPPVIFFQCSPAFQSFQNLSNYATNWGSSPQYMRVLEGHFISKP